MGDVRFLKVYERLRDARDRAAMLRAFSDDEVIQALGAASLPEAADPYLANVLASEALNRLRRARIMTQHVAEAILHVDADGVCLDTNPAAIHLVGRSLDELIGHHLAAVIELHDTSGAAASSGEDPFAVGSLDAGETERTGRIRRPDGSMLDVAYRSAPVTRERETVGAVIAMRDATEEIRARTALGRSDARHRTLLDSVPEYAMVLLSPDGIVESWNEGASRIHEFDAGEIIGRHFRAFYTSEDQRRELPEHELSLAARQGRFRAEEDRVRRDGTTFRALVELTAIRDTAGIRGFALIEKAADDAIRAPTLL